MELIQKSASETRRTLGVNLPTIIIVFLSPAISIFLYYALPIPVSDNLSGFIRWLVPIIIWAITMVIAFPALLVWNALRIMHQDRIVKAQVALALQTTKLRDDQMKSLLRSAMRNPWYGVSKCHAFGSIVRDYPTRDIDVVIQFNTSERKQVRIYRNRLRSFESTFRETYRQNLHVQTFLSEETAALQRFLNRAETHERLK